MPSTRSPATSLTRSRTPPCANNDEALLSTTQAIEALGRRVDALRVAGAAEIAERSRKELGTAGLAARNGCRNANEQLQRITQVSGVRSEVHHVTPDRDGGPTQVGNGVYLCWWHHRTIDTAGWQIRMVDGAPQIKAPPWVDPNARWRPASKARTTLADRLERRIT